MACGLPSAGKHIRDLLLHRRIESPVTQQTVQQIPPLPCCKQFRERNPVAGGQMFPVPCIHDPGGLVKTGHILPHCLEERGIDLPEDRKDLVPDLVAQIPVFGIGPVFSERDLVRGGIFFDFRTGEAQERTDQHAPLRQRTRRAHAPDALQPSTTQQIQHQGFSIVIRMVRHGHGSISARSTFQRKPRVTQVTRGHFNADALLSRIPGRIKMTDMERDAGLHAPFPYQHLIRIAVGAPEPEVAVQYLEGTPGPQEQIGHAHGVHAAADSQKDHPVRLTGQSFQCMDQSLQHGRKRFLRIISSKRRYR